MLANRLLDEPYPGMENEGFRPMVNRHETFRRTGGSEPAPLESLVSAYASKRLRPGYAAFLSLDRQLKDNAMAMREPALKQLRLAWWRDALANLDVVTRSSHPVLIAAKAHLSAKQEILTDLVDGWEELAVGDDPSTGALAVAGARAKVLANIAGNHPELGNAATRWTLVETAALCVNEAVRARLLDAARDIAPVRLPRRLRPLTILDGLALRALARGGGPLLGDRLSPLAAIRLGIFGR